MCAPSTPPALSPSTPGRIKVTRGGRRSSPRVTPRRPATRIRTKTPDHKPPQTSPFNGAAYPSPVPPIPSLGSFDPRGKRPACIWCYHYIIIYKIFNSTRCIMGFDVLDLSFLSLPSAHYFAFTCAYLYAAPL